jgi:exosome complex component CSL4
MPNEVLPGDRIATIEEYETGKNTYDDGMVIRTKMIGDAIVDKKERLVNVKNLSSNSFPKTGDIVIGLVEAVMGSMIITSISYVNYKPIVSKVECICPTRNIRKRNIALVKDLIKLRIIGNLNGTLHATLDGPDLGVLFTKCRKCGKQVVQMRDIIKCTECGWTDDRKLSSEFLKSDFIKIR